MMVYHGSGEKVFVPEICVGTRTLDYGTGFYTTTSGEQAEAWARRKLKGAAERAFVNVYELDEGCFSRLKVLHFGSPTEEWVDFVMSNRTDKDFRHDYDIVRGPVANDRVYAAFALYEGGLLGKQELIKELKTFLLVDQLLFHTEEALSCLRFMEAKEVRR